MVWIHPACGRVHPPGAVTCEQARKMIEQRGREIEHEMAHHRVDHPDCPDVHIHVIRLRHEREAEARRRARDILIG